MAKLKSIVTTGDLLGLQSTSRTKSKASKSSKNRTSISKGVLSLASMRLLSSLRAGPNIRVTNDTDPKNARSESSIAINPNNPYNMLAGSKRFIDPQKYEFSLAE